jgi:hypothetical protein
MIIMREGEKNGGLRSTCAFAGSMRNIWKVNELEKDEEGSSLGEQRRNRATKTARGRE